ncbi:carbohydrate kinase family protein [Planctomicrobium sp. SH661]|uniref:carbohydrate kinase family protein n=1 Tax=Planctomicrobium sp. SH661 TaxID=3448124 RepID=UPI003F5C3136
MSTGVHPIIVAGHVCLDVIPTFVHREGQPAPAILPGYLINVGPAVRSTGGAVSNTGLALHRLGTPVRLLGKIGDDLFGEEILRLLDAQGPGLSQGMVRVPGETTSYSIVINPPGVDRTFLHCPGANDTFVADEVQVESLADASLFHFGYPPLMQRMYADDGRELAALLQKVHAAGLTVSLDLCMVDPQSPAGQVNWHSLLRRVLPSVDLFCPSVDELMFMLDRPAFDRAVAADGFDPARHVNRDLLRQLSAESLKLGAGAVLIKLGNQGIYLRTSADQQRLESMGRGMPADIAAWTNREIYSPCFAVDVVGTTGSGDCTIAGFLSAFARGDAPETCVQCAVAVGAASVEAADAVSGVRPWSQIASRIAAGWPMQPALPSLQPHLARPS